MQDWGLGPRIDGGRGASGCPNFPVLRHVVEDLHPAGYALEFGVAEGTSLAIITAHMPAVGFDSWLGLPEDWGPYPAGSRACPIPSVPGANLVAGWYEDTLPIFDFSEVSPIGLVHIDCDLYSSATTVLEHVGPHLQPGCYLVFDEWDHGNPWHAEHEGRAWREYVAKTGTTFDVIGHDREAWAIQLTGTNG